LLRRIFAAILAAAAVAETYMHVSSSRSAQFATCADRQQTVQTLVAGRVKPAVFHPSNSYYCHRDALHLDECPQVSRVAGEQLIARHRQQREQRIYNIGSVTSSEQLACCARVNQMRTARQRRFDP
jgi:hypothetical protein